MKRIFMITIFAMIFVLGINNADAGKPDKPDGGGKGGKDGGSKVAMCHDGETIMVPEKKVDSHLAHGDFIIEPGGPCCSKTNPFDIPYPDDYCTYEWDWTICNWVLIDCCEPGPLPDGYDADNCRWCAKTCSWRCHSDTDGIWTWVPEYCGWTHIGPAP